MVLKRSEHFRVLLSNVCERERGGGGVFRDFNQKNLHLFYNS